MAHVRLFLKAVGGKWLILPGTISGCVGVAGYMREELGLSWVPEISLFGLIGLALIPIVGWALIGLTHTVVLQSRRLSELEEAWDRTGRNLIPIREAMDIIIKNLSDQWPDDIDETEKRRRAAIKLRELGKENQILIWGYECLDNPQVFRDDRTQIPPVFWIRCMIEIENVYARDSTPDGPILHTIEDPAYAYDAESPAEYGDLRINRRSLEAACPPANT